MCFDYDRCDAYDSDIRRAIKEHRCEGCGGLVLSGDLYFYESGVFEGEPFSRKSCGACRRNMQLIHNDEISEGCREFEAWIIPEDLQGYLIEREGEFEWPLSTRDEGQEYLKEKQRRLRMLGPHLPWSEQRTREAEVIASGRAGILLFGEVVDMSEFPDATPLKQPVVTH